LAKLVGQPRAVTQSHASPLTQDDLRQDHLKRHPVLQAVAKAGFASRLHADWNISVVAFKGYARKASFFSLWSKKLLHFWLAIELTQKFLTLGKIHYALNIFRY
jgi:hypothetical protein